MSLLFIFLPSNTYSFKSICSMPSPMLGIRESTVNLTDITSLHRTPLVREVNLKFLSNKYNNSKF